MATVDMRNGDTVGAPSRWASVETPYFVQIDIDLEKAQKEKGSDLAASDVIQVLQVPEDTVIQLAGVELVEAVEGATALTVNVATENNAVSYATGFDAVGSDVGDQSVGTTPAVYGAVDDVALTLATLTGTVTGGVLRVFALMLDIKEHSTAGIAQPGS